MTQNEELVLSILKYIIRDNVQNLGHVPMGFYDEVIEDYKKRITPLYYKFSVNMSQSEKIKSVKILSVEGYDVMNKTYQGYPCFEKIKDLLEQFLNNVVND